MLSSVAHMTILSAFMCDECTKSILPIVCRMPESILWSDSQVCWPSTECLVFQVVPCTNKYFNTICERTCDNSPTDSNSSCLTWWSSRERLETLFHCSTFLFASSQYRWTHFRACPSMSYEHATVFSWGFSHNSNFSVAPAEICDSNIFVYSSRIISFTWTRNDVGSSRSTCFSNFFHMEAICWFFPVSSTYTGKYNPCFQWKKDIPSSILFPIQAPIEPLRTVPSTSDQQVGVRFNFRSRGTTRSSMLDQDFGHLCRGRRIHTAGHSDLGILSNLGASSIFTDVWADTASTACPSQSANLATTSITFAALIWNADEPCPQKLRKLQSLLLQCHHGARLCLLYFCNLGYNSAFVERHR